MTKTNRANRAVLAALSKQSSEEWIANNRRSYSVHSLINLRGSVSIRVSCLPWLRDRVVDRRSLSNLDVIIHRAWDASDERKSVLRRYLTRLGVPADRIAARLE